MNSLSLENLGTIGSGLYRPECVIATIGNTLYSADWRGGVCITNSHGQSELIKAQNIGFEIRPNGIALLPDGDFLLAHLGEDAGGLYRLSRNGECIALLKEIDGNPIPPSNYPHLDHQGRVWLTVSTRKQPRASAYRQDVADGFIVLIDDGNAKIVADGLGYTNECCVHPDGRRLYVNETFGRRLTSFDIADNGDLSNKKTITEFGAGTFPDGLTFDCEGGVWITSIVSNRVIRINPQGKHQVLLEDVDPQHLACTEAAYENHSMGRPHLDQAHSKRLKNISSLAFGGADLKTGYLGCLLGDHITTFKSPVAGWAPAHWNFPLVSG